MRHPTGAVTAMGSDKRRRNSCSESAQPRIAGMSSVDFGPDPALRSMAEDHTNLDLAGLHASGELQNSVHGSSRSKP
jgi:hypothetical protein